MGCGVRRLGAGCGVSGASCLGHDASKRPFPLEHVCLSWFIHQRVTSKRLGCSPANSYNLMGSKVIIQAVLIEVLFLFTLRCQLLPCACILGDTPCRLSLRRPCDHAVQLGVLSGKRVADGSPPPQVPPAAHARRTRKPMTWHFVELLAFFFFF